MMPSGAVMTTQGEGVAWHTFADLLTEPPGLLKVLQLCNTCLWILWNHQPTGGL
jgi:hypothetical protein